VEAHEMFDTVKHFVWDIRIIQTNASKCWTDQET